MLLPRQTSSSVTASLQTAHPPCLSVSLPPCLYLSAFFSMSQPQYQKLDLSFTLLCDLEKVKGGWSPSSYCSKCWHRQEQLNQGVRKIQLSEIFRLLSALQYFEASTFMVLLMLSW